MTTMIPIALFGWIAVVLLMFAAMPPRKAMLAAVVLGWLFLPNASFYVPLLRMYNKPAAVTLSVLLGVCIFDAKRLSTMRLAWVDLPMLVWCLCPLASSLSNDLGFYDGAAEAMGQCMAWGGAYLLGRLYLADSKGLRALAISLVIGGVIYVPFCLSEMKAGPFWHIKVYGTYPHSWLESMRYGGFRPSVFLVHGLWLAWFMLCASVLAVSFWASGRVRQFFSVPSWLIAVILVITTVLCKSTGVVALLMVGIVPVLLRRFRTFMVVCLIAAPVAYVGLRMTGMWDGLVLVEAAQGVDADRADSMLVRLQFEDTLVKRAMQHPLFGWGGWGRSTEGTGVWTEGMWVLALGRMGLVGLAAWLGASLIPSAVALARVGRRGLSDPANAPLLALLVLVPLHVINGLVVVDFSPINYLMTGAVAAFASSHATGRRPILGPTEGRKGTSTQRNGRLRHRIVDVVAEPRAVRELRAPGLG